MRSKRNFNMLLIFSVVAILCFSSFSVLSSTITRNDFNKNYLYYAFTPDMKSDIPSYKSDIYSMGYSDELVAGANYLVHAQADITEDNAGNGFDGSETPEDPDDGGWDWSSTIFTHSTSASPTNIFGATAQGLYYAYLETSDPSYMTAMDDVAYQMSIDPTIDSAADLIWLMLYDDISSSPGTWDSLAKTKYDAKISSYGTAQGLAVYIRDARAGSYPNGIIAWDIGAWVRVAAMLDSIYGGYASDADDMAEVLWEDSFNDNPGYFDIIDDQGYDAGYADVNFWWYPLGISGLIDAFDAAQVHTSEIAGLISILLGCQCSNGAFSFQYGGFSGDEDWQATAYAVMSLAMYDQSTYQSIINDAFYWLAATQDPVSGGWVYSSGNHYPEIGGENIAAMYYYGFIQNIDTGEIFTSYQAAIDDSDTLNGHTIQAMWPGSYTGARVYKSLTILGASTGTTIINSGVHYGGGAPGLTTGFHLDAGSDGTEIRYFTFNCDSSSGYYFGIFSRGIDNVIIDSTIINDAVQGITNWGGSNWEITNNVLHDTVASGGGGIGIFLGATPALTECSNNLVQFNTIYADGTEAGYTAPGICLCLDLRYGGYDILTGFENVENNQILDNLIIGTGNLYEVGIEVGVIGVSGDPIKIGNTMGMVHDNYVIGNIIDGSDYGIYAYVVDNLAIECNEVTNCVTHGISIWDDFTGNINYNDIVGNGYGLYSDVSTTMINAECNWWGSHSGPSDFGPGTGDAVSDYVDFDPWIHVVADAGGPYSLEGTSTVTFDSSLSSFGACGTVTYEWDFGDGTFSSDANPTHTYPMGSERTYNVVLTITVETTCGNTYSDVDTVNVGIDSDPPLVQLNFPRGGEIVSGTIIIDYYAIDDDYPGEEDNELPIYIYYTTNGQTLRAVTDDLPLRNDGYYTWDTTKYGDGEYKIVVEAQDKAGNVVQDSGNEHTFTIDNGNAGVRVSDVEMVNIETGSKKYVKNGDEIEITAGITGREAQGLTVDDITADLSGFNLGSDVHPDSFDGFTATWNVKNILCTPLDGTLDIIVKIAGDDNSYSKSITSDNTAPVISISKPVNGVYIRSMRIFPLPLDRTIIFGATDVVVSADDVSVDRVEFYVEGKLFKKDFEGQYDWSMNLRTWGTHTLTIVTYDSAGNSASESMDVTIYNYLGMDW